MIHLFALNCFMVLLYNVYQRLYVQRFDVYVSNRYLGFYSENSHTACIWSMNVIFSFKFPVLYIYFLLDCLFFYSSSLLTILDEKCILVLLMMLLILLKPLLH